MMTLIHAAAAGSWSDDYCLAFMGIDNGADPSKLSLLCRIRSLTRSFPLPSQWSLRTGGASTTDRSCGSRTSPSVLAMPPSRSTGTASRTSSTTPTRPAVRAGTGARSGRRALDGMRTAARHSRVRLRSGRSLNCRHERRIGDQRWGSRRREMGVVGVSVLFITGMDDRIPLLWNNAITAPPPFERVFQRNVASPAHLLRSGDGSSTAFNRVTASGDYCFVIEA
jgi:hypothetical protein